MTNPRHQIQNTAAHVNDTKTFMDHMQELLQALIIKLESIIIYYLFLLMISTVKLKLNNSPEASD